MEALLQFVTLHLVDHVELKALKCASKVVIRKVTGISDKEGKTRAIAIGDYWSQTALRSLHL